MFILKLLSLTNPSVWTVNSSGFGQIEWHLYIYKSTLPGIVDYPDRCPELLLLWSSNFSVEKDLRCKYEERMPAYIFSVFLLKAYPLF